MRLNIFSFLTLCAAVFSQASLGAALGEPLNIKRIAFPEADAPAIIVGPEGDMTVSYQGSAGFLAAIQQAVMQGASAADPVNVFIKPGTYAPGNFSIPDGINLIGLNVDPTCPHGTPGLVVVNVDYVTIVDASCDAQNISFEPIELQNAAFNVLNSTVAFVNCYTGNVNASTGMCHINFQNCCCANPGSTSGAGTFNFTNCTLLSQFYATSAAVTVNLVNSTVADEFQVNNQTQLDMYFYNCTLANVNYANNGTLNITLDASSEGMFNLLSGALANITRDPIVPPSID